MTIETAKFIRNVLFLEMVKAAKSGDQDLVADLLIALRDLGVEFGFVDPIFGDLFNHTEECWV